MKKIVISFLVMLVLTGGTIWLARHMSGTELHCRATFEKNTVTGLHVRGGLAVHLFREHSGMASVSGKIMTGDGTYTINREIDFIYEGVDVRNGVFRVKQTAFRTLSRDTMPARYDDYIDMNTESRSSDYMIIRKINKNTFLFASPTAPIILCVSD
ncbi:hypothetical protein DEI20_24260 [Salmonella enterica subsp. enterica serovar Newport]|nr:hypothetical protein [Salmonella enterica subsp. enterica serovar Newport]MJR82498.1 hypothetical protein [Salmonella enterica subsp. enterica serovar Newport]HAE2415416.1 hypothetical protein [Salmonella enterica subsp. enterica serovar Newport]